MGNKKPGRSGLSVFRVGLLFAPVGLASALWRGARRRLAGGRCGVSQPPRAHGANITTMATAAERIARAASFRCLAL